MNMIDYHVHTYLCRHALGEPRDYVDVALKKGLKEIGIADHFPLELMGITPKAKVSMDADELELYFRMVREASRTGGITVKTGIELDYAPGKMEKLATVLKDYPFDYIIGSVHFMGDWDFTHPYSAGEFEKRPIEEVYEQYFTLVCGACRSGLIDIIGHIDVVKKFNYRPSEKFLQPWYEKLAKLLRETGVCLELNTSGLDMPAGEFYPAPALLSRCIDEGVNIVLGSDAHTPEDVGRHFPLAMDMLREMGVRETVVFSRRKGVLQPLE
jgi:histidinol-phosphatase (PHP family)